MGTSVWIMARCASFVFTCCTNTCAVLYRTRGNPQPMHTRTRRSRFFPATCDDLRSSNRRSLLFLFGTETVNYNHNTHTTPVYTERSRCRRIPPPLGCRSRPRKIRGKADGAPECARVSINFRSHKDKENHRYPTDISAFKEVLGPSRENKS